MAQHRRFGLALALALVAGTPWLLSAQEKAATPEAAVEQFMKAVADSNLNRMSELWGTDKGSSASTKAPSDRAKRIYIMYSYLKGGTARVATQAVHVPESDKKRQLLVDFRRGDCTKMVPFTAVESKDGWLVNAIDLNAVGVPGRNCSEAPRPAPDSSKGSN